VKAPFVRSFHVATTPIPLEAVPSPSAKPALSAVVAAEDLMTARRVQAALAADDIVTVVAGRGAAELVARAEELRADVVVLCCELGRALEMSTLRQLRRALRHGAIVVVGTGSVQSRVSEVLNTGADGLVPEADVDTALAPVARAVAAGQVTVPRHLRRCLVRPAFSHRERQVLALMASGLQNREIADKLFLAESTVKSHLASSFEKLGVRSRKEAAALVLDPDEGLRALIFENGLGR
jgi:DNA-binding NarL/FixJ family response regulator